MGIYLRMGRSQMILIVFLIIFFTFKIFYNVHM